MDNIQKVVLPSNGLLQVEQEVTIRGMKGREISTLYSSLTEAAVDAIISAVTNPQLDPDLLCDEDKKFILHKTRVLTFGNETYQTLRCPHCGVIYEYEISYNDFDVQMLDEKYLTDSITLSNGDIITRKVPIKKHWTEINRYKEKTNLTNDYAYILMQISRIDTINGKRKSIPDLISYLENLPGVELVKLAKELEIKFGLDTTFKVDCNNCNTTFTGGLGFTADLFR